jgi:CheY-like chemotaxis protein
MPSNTILVVDDDLCNLKLVGFTLRREGYTVYTATDGAQALDIAARETLDAVLLDLNMPILDGPAFVREARARGYTSPITVMSAAEEAPERARELGAVGCLAKPFTIDELLSSIEGPLASLTVGAAA